MGIQAPNAQQESTMTKRDQTAERQTRILDHAMAKGWVGFVATISNKTAVPDPATGFYKVAQFTGEMRTQRPGEIQVGVANHAYYDDSRKSACHGWLMLGTIMKGNTLYPLIDRCPDAFLPQEERTPAPVPVPVASGAGPANVRDMLDALGNRTEQMLTHSKVQAGVQSELIKVIRELVTSTRDLTAAMELNAQAVADQQRPPMRRRPLHPVDTEGEPVKTAGHGS